MKTRSVVESRLNRLKKRYLHSHLKSVFQRRHASCLHNYLHRPNALPYSASDLDVELDISPRKVTTLLVMQDSQAPIRLCMYGASDPSSWNGDVCDTDEKAGSCPYFRPRLTLPEAVAQFNSLLEDDKYVLRTFPDLAVLQWVLSTRVRKLGILTRIWLWWEGRKLKSLPPAEEEPALPADFWS